MSSLKYLSLRNRIIRGGPDEAVRAAALGQEIFAQSLSTGYLFNTLGPTSSFIFKTHLGPLGNLGAKGLKLAYLPTDRGLVEKIIPAGLDVRKSDDLQTAFAYAAETGQMNRETAHMRTYRHFVVRRSSARLNEKFWGPGVDLRNWLGNATAYTGGVNATSRGRYASITIPGSHVTMNLGGYNGKLRFLDGGAQVENRSTNSASVTILGPVNPLFSGAYKSIRVNGKNVHDLIAGAARHATEEAFTTGGRPSIAIIKDRIARSPIAIGPSHEMMPHLTRTAAAAIAPEAGYYGQARLRPETLHL